MSSSSMTEDVPPPLGEVSLSLFSPGKVYLRYRAVSTLPLGNVWAAVRDSLYSDWDPVARSRTIVRKAQRPIELGNGAALARPGPLNRNSLPPAVNVICSPDDTKIQCIVTYSIFQSQAPLTARTIHTVRREGGKTIYEFEEIFLHPAQLADRVVADNVRLTGCLPIDHTSSQWKWELLDDVLQMGDAIVRRSLLVR